MIFYNLSANKEQREINYSRSLDCQYFIKLPDYIGPQIPIYIEYKETIV